MPRSRVNLILSHLLSVLIDANLNSEIDPIKILKKNLSQLIHRPAYCRSRRGEQSVNVPKIAEKKSA